MTKTISSLLLERPGQAGKGAQSEGWQTHCLGGMRGDVWEDYLEGRERMDFIKTAQPQWMNVNVSDTRRLDEFFDHTGSA